MAITPYPIAETNMGTTLTLDPLGTNTIIADITDIGPIGPTSTETDTTTLNSPNGYKEFIPSLKDAGMLTLKGKIKSEVSMTAMVALAESQVMKTYVITSILGSTWTFTAFVAKWNEVGAKVGGVREFDGSLRISGKPVYVAGGISYVSA